MRSPPREYPLPARLIPGVFPFVNKQLSRVKKKIRGVLGSSLVWLFIVSDTMLPLKEWPWYSWSFYSNDRVREGKHCRFEVCPRGKKGAKTPDECMLFFRSDDKMWKWAAVKIKKTKPWVLIIAGLRWSTQGSWEILIQVWKLKGKSILFFWSKIWWLDCREKYHRKCFWTKERIPD